PAVQRLLSVLDDAPTRRCVEAERAMNRALHGSCHVPVAAFAEQLDGGRLQLHGMVGDAATGRLLRAQAGGDDPGALGEDVAGRLLADGAAAMLAPPA